MSTTLLQLPGESFGSIPEWNMEHGEHSSGLVQRCSITDHGCLLVKQPVNVVPCPVRNFFNEAQGYYTVSLAPYWLACPWSLGLREVFMRFSFLHARYDSLCSHTATAVLR